MYFKMIDVGHKEATRRRAIAQGKISLSYDAFFALKNGKNPKGNVLALAEVAGIMAAKKTSEVIPLCHPLPLDYVKLSFSLDEGDYSVTAFCEVGTVAKTGVEMEALSGVNGALLSIYDLSKAVNPALTISDIRLNFKEGGKSGVWFHPNSDRDNSEQINLPVNLDATQERGLFQGQRVSVITISDRVSTGTMTDLSGPAIQEFFCARGAEVKMDQPVPDEKIQIQAAVRKEIQNGAQLILTTGGTGIGPRDRTPEALEEICDRVIPGFGECLRSQGTQYTPMAWLSRSLGVLIGNAVVIALPGSSKAVVEGLEALEHLLPHALHIALGGHHEKRKTHDATKPIEI